jgi:quercetin dioxygenase-like cupin family protein
VSERWQCVKLDDVEPIFFADGPLWRPLRRTLGIEAFGCNAYVAHNAGDQVVDRHTEEERQHEEIYVVLAGRATFTLDDETVDAPAGSVVFVKDPSVTRAAHAEEPGTAVLAVGGRPGTPYEPSAWEWYFYAERFRPSGDWDSAIAHVRDGLERYPDHPGMRYALACYEALAGRHDDALAHLHESLELDPRLQDCARKDDDLASIRDRMIT